MSLLYRIAISLVRGIGNITARQLLDYVDDPAVLFTEKKQLLAKLPGLSPRLITELLNPEVLRRAEEEIAFIEKNRITPLFIQGDEAYPARLRECIDAPVMLYYRGSADLNAERVISIVGTRNASVYGKEQTQRLLREISQLFPDTLIVSGLAYGIDITAHRAALKYELPTVGILAHGLDRIYPYDHRATAAEMVGRGGLLTDFISGTVPDRHNFVKRNRIIAGISDSTIVVESAKKGGALITAYLADSYNRDVLAFPGRTSDPYSKGCNRLIRQRQASLITCADDLFDEMGWKDPRTEPARPIQRQLLLDLTPDEESVVNILTKGEMQLNVLTIELNKPISQLTAILFNLEMKGVVRCLPGGLYRLL